MIHIALFKDTGKFRPGIYRGWLGLPRKVGLNLVSEDTDRFIRAFADPMMLDKSHGVVVVSGSFQTSGEKYGNRSMLYVPLEAGHVAQNIHLAASELGVGTVEIGGFVEELLAEALELPKHYYPLTTVIFGNEEKASLSENLKVEVHWTAPFAGKYRLPFVMAHARVSAVINEDWSYGRDISPSLARTKAIAESREWAACGCVPDTLVRARLSDLKTAIDPREIVMFHPTQYRLKSFPFVPFDMEQEYTWVVGKDEMCGSKVHVLADLVYFPYYPQTPLYAYANSSGVAANPERQKAIETSTLELIERESFMIAYLAKLSLPTVSERTLPEAIRKRIKELRKVGFEIWIKDHSLDLAPVAFVFAQNKTLFFTTCASCSSFDVEHAVGHALMEVEASVLARFQNGPAAFRRPKEVAMPADHGAIYEQEQFFQKADFLVGGQDSIAFRKIGHGVSTSWQTLLERFSANGWPLITVPLILSKEFGGNDGLHIIRSIVPSMVPMTFGYRQEPKGMERLYSVAQRFRRTQLLCRDISTFPHPFA